MIYVLTREINCYDQEGAYFEHAWTHKPTIKELQKYTDEGDEYNQWLLDTLGGRRSYEYTWYNLEVLDD